MSLLRCYDDARGGQQKDAEHPQRQEGGWGCHGWVCNFCACLPPLCFDDTSDPDLLYAFPFGAVLVAGEPFYCNVLCVFRGIQRTQGWPGRPATLYVLANDFGARGRLYHQSARYRGTSGKGSDT